MRSTSHPVVTAFHATTPIHTLFGIDILSAIQPVVLPGALQRVHARLIDGVRVIRNSHEHVVSGRGVITNATPKVTAVVGGSATGVSPGATRFVFHCAVVTRAKRSQVPAQNICSRHKESSQNRDVVAILSRSLYGRTAPR